MLTQEQRQKLKTQEHRDDSLTAILIDLMTELYLLFQRTSSLQENEVPVEQIHISS